MSNFLKYRCPSTMMPLLLLLSLLLAFGRQSAMAAETPPAYQPDIEYYLSKVEAEKKQGFLKEEIKKYRSYPRLDRAYRLLNARRLEESRQEFAAYLALTPEDIRSRISYLGLLDKLSRNDEVIAQADFIISRWPAFVPAYFFKGQAFRKLGNTDRAFAVFASAAAAKEIQIKDLAYALSMATDLALDLKNYENAGNLLQRLQEIENKYVWHMKAGVVYEKSAHLPESMAAYSAAQDSAQSPTEKLAASLALAEIAKKLSDLERARQAYEVALASDNSNQAALRGLAYLAYLGKRYDEAEKWMVPLTRNSSYPEDREFLANLYLKRSDYAAAIQELKALVEQQGKKTSPETLTALAQAYESAGKFKESAEVYESLTQNAPANGESLLRYGNLLIRTERFREAGPLLKKALLSNLTVQQKTMAHKNLALVYEKSGNYEEAAQELEKSLSNQPQPEGEQMVRLALLLNKAGRADKALQYLDQALAEPALSADLKWLAHREKSSIFEKNGQTAQAASELEKALQLDRKEDAETIIRLAVLLNKSDRSAEALRYLDRALAEPSLAIYLKRLALREKGLLLEKAGQRREAAQAYENAMSLGDTSPGIYLLMANLQQSAKNFEIAAPYFQKVLDHPAATKSEKCGAEEGFGLNDFKQDRITEAFSHFSAALHRCGANWQRRYYLGLAHYRSTQWEQALEQFLLADGLKKDPASLLGIALCHKEMGRPEAAVPYLLQALQERGNATPEILKQINDTLGYLYAAEQAYDKAAEAFSQSIALSPDQLVSMKLASVFNRAGKTDAAWNALQDVDPAKLPAAEIIEYNDLKAELLQKMGRYAEALALMEQTQTLQATPARSYALGMLCQGAGQLPKAIEYFKTAYAREPQQDDYAMALGYAYAADGRVNDAIGIFEVVAARKPDSPKVREELGYLYSLLGKHERAALWFKQALDSFPVMPQTASTEKDQKEKDAQRIRDENWQRHYNLGLAYYRSKLWEQALAQFLLADGLKKDPASLLGIALCHKEAGRPGAAVHYLQSALLEPGKTTPETLKQINDTLGYLYAEEYDYDKAAEAFRRSLALTPDQIVAMKLATVLNSGAKTDAAWKALEDFNPAKLSSAGLVEYNDLKADLLQKMGRYAEALALMEQNQALQATPARSYAMGMLCQNAGQRHKAMEYFQTAYSKEPQQDDYALALGYAYIADERHNDAIGIFEVVATRKPESPKVREELGYLNSFIGKNEQAALWFKQALDTFPVMPLGTSTEIEQWEKDAHRIRSEISKLTKSFNLVLYASYRAGKPPNAFLANGEQINGGLNGQLGLEASYRPPPIGLQNDRIFELFGRIFGNLNPNSLSYNDRSTQAGLGLRYKFLQKENLWISGEKLFKIGNDALDDWLFRLLYSRGKGTELLPLERTQDYYLLYGELDGYLRNETAAAYGEVRKGLAFTFLSNYLLIPYLVVDARWQSPFSAGGNYGEGGVGISLKYFFNSTKYENYRNAVDFSITYKHGKFFTDGFHKYGGDYNSTLLSLGLYF